MKIKEKTLASFDNLAQRRKIKKKGRISMKNQIVKKLLAGSMAIVIGAGAVGIYDYSHPEMTAVRAEDETQQLKEAAEEVLGDSTKKDEGEFFKDESVYVKADASGNVEETVVTEWLKNPGSGEVEDTSELQDIENIKGDETFSRGSDGEIAWNAEGEDIYYQGTTSKALPVEVKLSYKLDGKSISAEELKGKSGKVEIRIDYINNSMKTVSIKKKKVKMYTPFTVVTALMLPTEEYKNVTIDNGKIVSDADKDIVAGLAFPGLKENLKLEKLDVDIPESVTITADVRNASVGSTVTVVTADMIDKLGFDKVNDFDSFESSINDLDDAAKKLSYGSNELADGVKTLDSKTGELNDGVNQVAEGVNSYVGGVRELAAGSEQLTQGADALKQGAVAAQAGIASAKEGADALVGNYDAAVNGAAQLSGGLKELSSALSQSQMNIALPDVDAQLSGAIAPMASQMAAGAVANIPDEVFEQLGTTRDAYVAGLTQTYAGILTEGLSGLGPQLNGALEQTAAQVQGEIEGKMGVIKQNVDALAGGADSLAGGISQLKDGTVKLQGGLGQLNDGSGALVQGTSDLYNGAYALQQGAAKLNDAGSVLQTGTQKLKDGGSQFAAGVSELAGGSTTLADGMNEFKTTGIDELTKVFNGDIKNVTDRIDAMKKLGKKYSSFAGIKDGAAGSTKFIIETKGIEE